MRYGAEDVKLELRFLRPIFFLKEKKDVLVQAVVVGNLHHKIKSKLKKNSRSSWDLLDPILKFVYWCLHFDLETL